VSFPTLSTSSVESPTSVSITASGESASIQWKRAAGHRKPAIRPWKYWSISEVFVEQWWSIHHTSRLRTVDAIKSVGCALAACDQKMALDPDECARDHPN